MDGWMDTVETTGFSVLGFHVFTTRRKLEFNEGDIGLAGGIQAPKRQHGLIIGEYREKCILYVFFFGHTN